MAINEYPTQQYCDINASFIPAADHDHDHDDIHALLHVLPSSSDQYSLASLHDFAEQTNIGYTDRQLETDDLDFHYENLLNYNEGEDEGKPYIDVPVQPKQSLQYIAAPKLTESAHAAYPVNDMSSCASSFHRIYEAGPDGCDPAILLKPATAGATAIYPVRNHYDAESTPHIALNKTALQVPISTYYPLLAGNHRGNNDTATLPYDFAHAAARISTSSRSFPTLPTNPATDNEGTTSSGPSTNKGVLFDCKRVTSDSCIKLVLKTTGGIDKRKQQRAKLGASSVQHTRKGHHLHSTSRSNFDASASQQIIDGEEIDPMNEKGVLIMMETQNPKFNDGYKWRTYGVKYIEGDKYQRTYWRCAESGCQVKKRTQRCSHDDNYTKFEYFGRHTHH